MHVIALSNFPYCGSVTGFSLRESSASGSFLASFSVTQYHPSAWFMMRLRNIYSILLLVNQQFMYWLYDSVADRETGESLATWTPKFEGRCRCLKAFEKSKISRKSFPLICNPHIDEFCPRLNVWRFRCRMCGQPFCFFKERAWFMGEERQGPYPTSPFQPSAEIELRLLDTGAHAALLLEIWNMSQRRFIHPWLEINWVNNCLSWSSAKSLRLTDVN